jgi:hypothetical protein
VREVSDRLGPVARAGHNRGDVKHGIDAAEPAEHRFECGNDLVLARNVAMERERLRTDPGGRSPFAAVDVQERDPCPLLGETPGRRAADAAPPVITATLPASLAFVIALSSLPQAVSVSQAARPTTFSRARRSIACSSYPRPSRI